MNVTLSNDEYATLVELAREKGQLTEQLAANLIIDGFSR